MSSWPLKQGCGSFLTCVFMSPANIDSIDCLSFCVKTATISLRGPWNGAVVWRSGADCCSCPSWPTVPGAARPADQCPEVVFWHAIFSGEPPDRRATRCRYFILGDKMASLAGGLESLNSSYCNWKILGRDKKWSGKAYKQTSIKGQFVWPLAIFDERTKCVSRVW